MRLGLLVRARLFNCICYVGQPSGTSQACAAPMPRARWQAGDLQSRCALRYSVPARVRTFKTWYLANLRTLYRTETPGAPQLWSPEYGRHAIRIAPPRTRCMLRQTGALAARPSTKADRDNHSNQKVCHDASCLC